MGEGLSHWSSMVLRKSQTYFFDRHTHPNSMYSNFCHVLKGNITNNKTGLKFALQNGCEPSLYVTAISELISDKKVDIVGKFNKQATNIHKVVEYTIVLIR